MTTTAPPRSVLLLVAGGLVAVRVATTGHAPVIADAVCAAIAAALVVVGAPAWWPRAALAVVIGAAASIATSRDPWTSLLALSLVLGAVAFVALGARRALHDGVVAGLVIGGVVHSGVALDQHFVLWPDALARREELQLSASLVDRLASGRPLGLSLSPDLAAALALAAAAAALAIVVDTARAKTVRALAVVALVPTAAAIVLSRSYGTALALGVAVVVVAFARRAWVLLGGLVACVAVVAAAAAARGLGAVVVSAGERVANWRVGWAAFVDAPATGHGLLRFAAAYAERRPPDANVTRYAHGALVQILAETGVVGVAGVVVAIAVVAPRLVRALRGPPASAALAGGVVALAARAVVDYDLHVGQTAMVFGVLAGLAVASDDDTHGGLDSEPATTAWARRTAAGIAVAAALLSMLLIWRDAAGADSLLARVDVEVALRNAVALPEPAARRALLSPFAATTPAAAVVAARAAIDEGDVAAALGLLEQARARDPGLPAVHQLLVALARQGVGDLPAREADARRYHVDVR